MANTVIPAGLRADIMRNQMESKNTLKNKGSLYVGTGSTQTVGGSTIYTTDELPKGVEGSILFTDASGSNGLKWRKLQASDIDGNIPASKITGSVPVTGNISASQITSGTLDKNRLPSDIPVEKLDRGWIQVGVAGGERWEIGKIVSSINVNLLSSKTIQIGTTSIALGTQTLKLEGLTTVQSANYYTASDERLKENIVKYQPKNSVLDLEVKEFDYKETKEHSIGFIAQELQEKFPELVKEREDGYLQIEENKLVYLLLEEVKILKKEIEELKQK